MKKRLIAAVLTLCLIASQAMPVFAEDSTPSNSIEAAAKVTELQNKINEVNEQVNSYNQQIADLQAQIAQTQAELDQAEADRAEQEEDLKARMRAIYMYGNDGYLEMMFSAQNLTELLTYFDLSKSIMTADKTIQTQLSNTKKVIEDSQKRLETSKNEIEKQKSESEAAQEALAEELKENKDLLSQLQLEEGPVTSAAVVALQAAGALAASGWTWPIDASASNAFLITSYMGTRESPGGIGSTDHQGTDIGASYGSAIVAAQAGTVTQSGYSGGYGNLVTIQTIDGFTTMYGHMSTIGVSVGDVVTAGQVIGQVGSTGNSTGPHLHFEVRTSDGVAINGLQFYGSDILNRLSYYDC